MRADNVCSWLFASVSSAAQNVRSTPNSGPSHLHCLIPSTNELIRSAAAQLVARRIGAVPQDTPRRSSGTSWQLKGAKMGLYYGPGDFLDDPEKFVHSAIMMNSALGDWLNLQEERCPQLLRPKLPDEASREMLMSRLTEFARAAIGDYERESHPPYQGEARRELERLRSLISELRPGTRNILRTVLIEDIGIDVEHLVFAIETAVARTSQELPSGGRPRTPAAELFITRCFYLWLHHAGQVPPRNPSSHSPFYLFVSAALPEEVYRRSDRPHVSDEITGLVCSVLKRAHKRFDRYVSMGWEHRPRD